MMDNSLMYNIPASLIAGHGGRSVIVRCYDPVQFLENVSVDDFSNISYVQILNPDADLRALKNWGPGIPVDILVGGTEADLPRLYQWSMLLADHPIRVTVPVVSGFGKVVRLATALNFAVKLDVLQPEPALVEEMLQVLHAYLHQTTVASPIEYFHSLFLAFYRNEPISLWAIQEDDPACVRYVTDDGEALLPRRYAGPEPRGDIASFVQEFKHELIAGGVACSCCEFLDQCAGYFRVPVGDYRCEGVKAIFETIREAAKQLRGDLAAFGAESGEER
jgi:hypothetical protein